MGRDIYIAGCVFAAAHPALHRRIMAYMASRGLPAVRCCTPNYKLREFEQRMAPALRPEWAALPDTGDWRPGDRAISVCHNCLNILEETVPEVQPVSLWAFILEDRDFPYPALSGEAWVQDCWRSRQRTDEQAAVRILLERMGLQIRELPEDGPFCGLSLHRPQPPRNPQLAPRYYKEGAAGLFVPKTPAEQTALMEAHCGPMGRMPVVCYCHYCLEGLLAGGARAVHLAALLFPEGGTYDRTS